MRKLIVLLLLLVTSNLYSQTYPIAGIIITLPANPDPIISRWTTGRSMLTISARTEMINGRISDVVRDSRILVIIKKSGSKLCGTNTPASAPSSNFSSANKTWNGANAVSLLGQECTLPPGDYELCVQFFGQGPAGSVAFSEEKCKPFNIKGSDEQYYQSPQNVSPANGTGFSEPDFKKPITFRWTAVIPRPVENVTYRLRVWQVMQGQSVGQAINQPPLLSNDVGQNQAAVIVGPGTMSPNNTLVWNVQALNREGKPIGSNNGTSEAFTITVNPVNDMPSVISLTTPVNGAVLNENETPTFKWAHTRQQPGPASTYKIRIIEIKGDQSPDEAFRTNKPFFEKDSIDALFFKYPANAERFQKGKRYAWGITASRNPPYGEVKITESGINEYSFGKEQRRPGDRTGNTKPFCTDFENGISNGWQGDHTAVTIISSGGNPGQFAQTQDQSGASTFFNSDPAYTGNWSDLISNGCGSLCFDVKYIDAGVGNTSPLAFHPAIYINGNGFTAVFVSNDSIHLGDGWHSYCAPLQYLNVDSTMPSNANGHWVMSGTGVAANWNTLLSNVQKVYLPTDPTSFQAEQFGYDNICIKSTGDCTPAIVIPCKPCDSTSIIAGNQSIVSLNAETGLIRIQNSISTTSLVTKIVADLVCVIIKPANSNCNVCNKEKNQQDHFSGSNRITTASGWAMNGVGEIAQESVNAITRSLTFASSSKAGVNISGGIIINHEVGIAPASCCGDKIEVWIRYTIWDRGCHVCDKLVKATLDRGTTCSTGTNDDHH
jgi:hypothetical protein